MPIPAHYYYSRYDGFSNVVRIESNWSEESAGYQNEHIHEIIAAIQGGKYYLIDAHLKRKTMGGEEFEITKKLKYLKMNMKKYLATIKA